MMRFPLRRLRLLATASFILSGCTSTTAPDDLRADPSVDFDAALARWNAGKASAYTFEVGTWTAMVPSIGYVQIDVAGGQVTRAQASATGAPVALGAVFTIDGLWSRLLSARARGVTPVDVQFSREGIPIDAMVGSFANDGGVLYRVRSFVVHN